MNHPFCSFLVRATIALAVYAGLAGCGSTASPTTDPVAARAGGQAFRECVGCPEMIVVPAGRFTMGSPPTEPDRDDAEGPQRDIAIARFAIGRTDVTRAEWAAFAAATDRPVATGCAWAGALGPRLDPTKSWRDVDPAQEDTHPVVCVTWDDARDYVRWLSSRTGHRYRLPSEAEWEYAARAGTRTAFPWGEVASHDHANYGSDVCCSGLAMATDRWIGTSPAGSFDANAFGLFDMHGNVLQWVQDCLATDYADLPADGSPFEKSRPLVADAFLLSGMEGTDSCAYRVLRGGDWGDPPSMIRSAFRNYGPPGGTTLATYRSAGVGFRVARSVD